MGSITPRLFDVDGRPLHVVWRYDRAEMVADGIVHALGLALGITGAVAIVGLTILYGDGPRTTAVVVYALALLALLSASAAYNLWPISRTKWLLRRFDHAAIFLLIAATYTPFMTRLEAGFASTMLFVGVWSVALFGATLKLTLPGRFDRLSVALCLGLGASGVLAWEAVSAALSGTTIALIIFGGLTYAVGVIFHLWESLRFQNAVWHGFVLVASAVFYSAILHGVVLA